MSIQRYSFVDGLGYPSTQSRIEDNEGQYVLYTARDAEVERLKDELYAVKGDRYRFMSALEKISAERDAAVRERGAAVEALRHVCKHLCQWKDVCETGCLVSDALAKIEGEQNATR